MHWKPNVMYRVFEDVGTEYDGDAEAMRVIYYWPPP
jgi:hypothetical protein